MRTGLYLGEVPIGKIVVAVAGENGIQLQEKTITPSKGDPIEVTPDIGIDGLSKVTVEPIPDAYIDTTTDNAPYAGDMLKGTVAFANTNKIEGELEDKDILEYSADGLSFKDGDLVVSSTNAERAIVKAEADISIAIEGADLGNATTADVLNGKTFTSENGLVIKGTGPILANLNATAANVLKDKKFIGANGTEQTGTMANNGSMTDTLNSTKTYKDIPAGYTTGGKVSLGTNVVDTTISSNAAAANTMLSGKKAYANGSLITGNIATKTSSNLTTSGATVYAPAGYYASQASKSISNGALSSPNISVSSSGVITATSGVSTSGYLSTSATKSNTKSLTTASGGTYALNPGESVTRAAGTYLTSELSVTVAASGSSGLNIFSIDNRIFKAEPGMTWEEWINSSYAPYGFSTLIDTTVSPTSYYIIIGDYTVFHESKPDDLRDLLVDNMAFAYSTVDPYSEIFTNGNYAVLKRG